MRFNPSRQASVLKRLTSHSTPDFIALADVFDDRLAGFTQFFIKSAHGRQLGHLESMNSLRECVEIPVSKVRFPILDDDEQLVDVFGIVIEPIHLAQTFGCMNRPAFQIAESARDELNQLFPNIRLSQVAILRAKDSIHRPIDPPLRVERAAEQIMRADHAIHQRFIVAVPVLIDKLLEIAGFRICVVIREKVARDFAAEQYRLFLIERGEIRIDPSR